MSSEPLFALCPAVLPGNKPSSASVGTIPAVFKTGMAFVEVFSLKQQLQNIHFAKRVNTFGIKSCIFFHNTKKNTLLSSLPIRNLRSEAPPMPASCCLTQFLSVRQGALPRCHGSYAPQARWSSLSAGASSLKTKWRRHPEECRRHVCQLKKSLSEFFRFPVLHVLGVHLPD